MSKKEHPFGFPQYSGSQLGMGFTRHTFLDTIRVDASHYEQHRDECLAHSSPQLVIFEQLFKLVNVV